uniref:Gypsy retrotransposon integrase-like protein 1 n=1 Tax=Nothobranchius rachovii TaxID=451742 RepID=A0A1A8R460_9TELE
MEGRWDEIFNLLTKGSYPLHYTKGQRQSLRKYASKFSIHAGGLFFGPLPRRRAIKSKEEAWTNFKEIHSSKMGGHSGIVKTRKSLCSKFYWHGMTVDIEKWLSECDHCQRVGPPLKVVETLDCIKVSGVWELVGMDLTGPLPQTPSGYKYILTATDYFSKWVEAFPLKTKSAEEVSQTLCTIFYRHGCPLRILTDQGQEFVNQINSKLCELLSIERSVTAAYHPQTNRLDEKTNDNIKRALRKVVNERQDDWDLYLDATLFSLRSKMHTTTKFSPFYLMYGREARFPCELPVEMPEGPVTDAGLPLPERPSSAPF